MQLTFAVNADHGEPRKVASQTVWPAGTVPWIGSGATSVETTHVAGLLQPFSIPTTWLWLPRASNVA